MRVAAFAAWFNKLTPMMGPNTSKPPDMDSIRVVSWDVDGTLYSTRGAAWHVAMRAAKLTIQKRRLEPFQEIIELGQLWRQVEQARSDEKIWFNSMPVPIGAGNSKTDGGRLRLGHQVHGRDLNRCWADFRDGCVPRSSSPTSKQTIN